jgi:predicted  nucleic acid-binding Zn-ribbon protein
MKNNNKASRKHGGFAWKKTSEDFEQTIDCVNGLRSLKKLPVFEEPRIPNFPKPDENGFSKEILEETYLGEMKKLECALRLLPIKVAVHILRRSKFLSVRNESEITEMIENKHLQLFHPILTGATCVIDDFLSCMRCYESLDHFYSTLEDLKQSWDTVEETISKFYEVDENRGEIKYFSGRFPRWDEHIQIGVNFEKKLHLSFNEPLKYLLGVEIDRIRQCIRCENIFWAGRKDMIGCKNCNSMIRKKRWRDSVPQETKQLYNEARKKKRLKLKAEALAQSQQAKNENSDFDFTSVNEKELEFLQLDKHEIGEIIEQDGKMYEVVGNSPRLLLKPVENKDKTKLGKIKNYLKNLGGNK